MIPLLRQAGLDDVSSMVEVRLEFMRIIKDGGLSDEEAWRTGLTRYFSAWMARGRLKAWLALVDGEVVASAGLRLDRPRRGGPGPWVGYVMSIYTRPAWRNQGLARSLMGCLIQEADRLCLPRLVLHPTEAGRPLYASLGFHPYRGIMILPKENYHGIPDRCL